MILIDPRIGSGELFPYLDSISGIKARLEHLEYGDVAFSGHTAKGLGMIAIERKKVRDILRCMQDGRWSGHQLPGMVDTYDHSWLVIEGIIRSGCGGLLEEASKGGWRPVGIGSQRTMFRSLDHFLTTVELRTPVKVRRCGTIDDTVSFIVDLYRYFNDKEWHQHKSFKQFHMISPPRLSFSKPPFRVRVAKEILGIGYELGYAVGEQFSSVTEMALASPAEWMCVPKIGAIKAERAVRQLNGEMEEEQDL